MKIKYIGIGLVVLAVVALLVPTSPVSLGGQDVSGEPYRVASTTVYSITATGGSAGTHVLKDNSFGYQRTVLIQNRDGSNVAHLCKATTTAHAYSTTAGSLNDCIYVAANGSVKFDATDPYQGSIVATSSTNMTISVIESTF